MEQDAHLSPVVPSDLPDNYPDSLDRTERLEDGSVVHIRPIVPADIDRLRHAFEVGDSDSIRRRFLTGAPPSDETHLQYLVNLDYRRRLALLALDTEGNSIGVGRYEGTEDLTSAEVAIVVAPEWRKRGVGTLLLTMLESPGMGVGLKRFVAAYQPSNGPVAELFDKLGYSERWFEDGLVWVAKPLS